MLQCYEQANADYVRLGFSSHKFKKYIRYALILRDGKMGHRDVVMFLMAPKCARILRFLYENPDILRATACYLDKAIVKHPNGTWGRDFGNRLHMLGLIQFGLHKFVPEIEFPQYHQMPAWFGGEHQAVAKALLVVVSACGVVNLSSLDKAKVMSALKRVFLDKFGTERHHYVLKEIVHIIKAFQAASTRGEYSDVLAEAKAIQQKPSGELLGAILRRNILGHLEASGTLKATLHIPR
jgi:hypothetical protein